MRRTKAVHTIDGIRDARQGGFALSDILALARQAKLDQGGSQEGSGLQDYEESNRRDHAKVRNEPPRQTARATAMQTTVIASRPAAIR